MAGADAAYRHLPFFYSDLFDLGYEAIGLLDPHLEVVADWKEPFRDGCRLLPRRRPRAGRARLGIFGKMDEARSLIAEPGPHAPEALRGRISA